MSVFPGLEATLDLTKKDPLFAVSLVARPAAARRLGEARLSRWLEARGVYGANKLAGGVVAAAEVQRHELPAAEGFVLDLPDGLETVLGDRGVRLSGESGSAWP